MTNLLKPALAGVALAALMSPLAIAPAMAQAAAPAVRGVGIVNVAGAVANSNAFKTAATQRQTTYKAQIDQYNARRQQLAAQLQPLVTKYQTDSRAATPNQASLQQQAAQIQQLQQAGQQELQQIVAPVQLSEAYAEEQIQDKLAAAIEAAARKKGVSLVLTPDNVLFADAAYNLSQAVVDELNTAIPSVAVTPPAGWLPRELREQQAQAAGAQAPAATPPAAARAPATSGRAPVSGR